MAGSCDPSVRVDPARVRGLQALLEPDAEPLREGDPLPPLWHWVALPGWGDPGLTGPDGHPRRPDRLAGTAVRRMFAGGEIVFSGTLRVGEEVAVATELGDVRTKVGRSGEFTLATFTTRVTNTSGECVLREQQDVVYTDARPSGRSVTSGALPIVGRPLRARPGGGYDLVTDPTVLLRFSALTANAHRIHFDLGYAREVELLPGLLVHGPLINLVLVRAACDLRDGSQVGRIVHRNLSPLFCGEHASVAACEQPDGTVVAELRGPEPDALKGRVAVDFIFSGSRESTERTAS